ncbi:MAG: DinB family protein [Chloroflexi bacterium]|nr:DinB family protein [Chloroflexota bacterium]
MPVIAQDLIADLDAGRAELKAAAESLSAEAALRKPSLGEWSATEILAHATEAQNMWIAMAHRILNEDRPTVGRVGEYAARRLGAVAVDGRKPVAELVSKLEGDGNELRKLLQSLAPEQLERKGQHATQGEKSLAGYLTALASHLREHAGEIRRLA